MSVCAIEIACGKDRIRTYEPLLTVTRFPGVPLQPLEHLSLLVGGFGVQNYTIIIK